MCYNTKILLYNVGGCMFNYLLGALDPAVAQVLGIIQYVIVAIVAVCALAIVPKK